MHEFISKIQHNTYEKGEFSDEKVRTLAETIELIKSFPFDAERTLTDIQLTGPSVTIQDEYVNYLKVGLYFNNKLCLYYLDNNNHLYECYVLNVSAACDIVIDFFYGQLDLEKFERHFFNIGNQAHFVTNYFEYKVSRVWLSLCFLLVIFLTLIALGGTVAFYMAKNIPLPVWILYIFLDLLTLQSLILLIRMSIKTINMTFVASAGLDIFKFGDNNELIDYDKKNIAEINIYGQTSRSSRLFNLMEITFIDKSSLIVPGSLIDPFSFIAKFKGVKISFVNGYIKAIKKMWLFTK